MTEYDILKFVIKSDLSVTSKLLYLYLLFVKEESGEVNKTTKEISKDCGISLGSVTNSKKELESYNPPYIFLSVGNDGKHKIIVNENFSTLPKFSDSFTRINTGYIYLISSGKYFKIGKTKYISKRFQAFKTIIPNEWNIVHSYKTKNIDEEEKRLHSMFKHKRVIGEWFNLNVSNIEYICSLKDD
jgi:hypothetical protein